MSKQTAVDVYYTHIRHLIAMGLKLSEPDRTFLNSAYRDCKAMEREQIKESYKAGFNYRDTFNWECDAPWDTKADLKHNEQEFEKYYIETYKGGEQ
jgi:hypothetical protein